MTSKDSQTNWAAGIATEARSAPSLTVGLVAGSTQQNDRRVVDRLIGNIADQLHAHGSCRTLLVVRLDVFRSKQLDRTADQLTTLPVAQRSPLGTWSEVAIPMPVGARASWSLMQVPKWLPTWKTSFGLIVIDLGPMDLVPSRTIGRLCDRCYALLGPDSCGSQEWLLRHIAWHDSSGSTICGTVVTKLSNAA